MKKSKGKRTSCAPTAHGAIARAVRIAADVSYARIQQALAPKGLAVHVLDAPEAACGDGRALGTGGRIHGGGGCGVHGEWAEEAGEKGHGEIGEHDEEDGAEDLQLC